MGEAAVVVLFHPDDLAVRALQQLCATFGTVLVVDNTPDSGSVELPPGAVLLHGGENIGLPRAYNLAAREALAQGAEWLATFDQDTLVDPRLPEVLARAATDFEEAHLGTSVGAVGPSFSNLHHASGDTGVEQTRVVDHVISSGMLLRLAHWKEVGGFDERLFIDLVDIDYCHRLNRAGHLVLQLPDVLMEHGMGAPAENRVAGRQRASSNYGQLRHYYIARNTALLTRDGVRGGAGLPSGLLVQRIKFWVLTLLVEPGRASKARAIGLGLWHGLRGHHGEASAQVRRRLA